MRDFKFFKLFAYILLNSHDMQCRMFYKMLYLHFQNFQYCKTWNLIFSIKVFRGLMPKDFEKHILETLLPTFKVFGRFGEFGHFHLFQK